MSPKLKKITVVLVCVLVLTGMLAQSAGAFILPRFPTGLFRPFGGEIKKKQWKFCLIPVPPPVFVIIIPFIYLEIGPPVPAKLYYFLGLSKLYREYQLEETAWTVGNYLFNAAETFKLICANRASLPRADGVVWKVGTSCKEGEGTSCAEKYNEANAPSLIAPPFDPLDFPDFCDPSSPPGTCTPPPPPE